MSGDHTCPPALILANIKANVLNNLLAGTLTSMPGENNQAQKEAFPGKLAQLNSNGRHFFERFGTVPHGTICLKLSSKR